jgi:phospholipase C
VEEGARDGRLTLTLANDGAQAAVLHVYDRLRLDQAPRRYTVEPGKQANDAWPPGAYDLWLLGPTASIATSSAERRARIRSCGS